MTQPFQLRDKLPADDSWITNISTKLWGSVQIISKEHTYNLLTLSNCIVELNGKPVGFVSYTKEGISYEIVALYCEVENQGIGTALIDHVKKAAKTDGCATVWIVTTNDNTQALRFYQKRGFVIKAVRTNIMEKQRKVKPTIPLLGNDTIPIRDEIELEIRL